MKQYLQYVWLFLTAVSASGTFGLGLILWRSYGRHSEMRFFLYVALAFFAVTFETLCAEARTPIAITDMSRVVPGLVGRIVESAGLWWVIWYLLGGQNSHIIPVPAPVVPVATTATVERPVEPSG